MLNIVSSLVVKTTPDRQTGRPTERATIIKCVGFLWRPRPHSNGSMGGCHEPTSILISDVCLSSHEMDISVMEGFQICGNLIRLSDDEFIRR